MKTLAWTTLPLAFAMAACEQPTSSAGSAPPPPDLRKVLPVHIGEATYRAGPRLPVSVTNLTGKKLDYIFLECAFIVDGRVVDTTQISWSNVRSAEMVTGTLLPNVDRADSTDCRPTASPM
ncbi:hypothetical protein ACIGFJ_17090 [Brevundimonas diminuta]|uniref:hypothetical protein n=1 Tax=Brevundimonas diminuta TaxID=293 RepID=UPI0037CC4DC6